MYLLVILLFLLRLPSPLQYHFDIYDFSRPVALQQDSSELSAPRNLQLNMAKRPNFLIIVADGMFTSTLYVHVSIRLTNVTTIRSGVFGYRLLWLRNPDARTGQAGQ